MRAFRWLPLLLLLLPPEIALAQSVRVAPAGLSVNEGEVVSITVELSGEPASTATFEFTGIEGLITAEPTSLTFTTTDWDDPQTVRLTVAEDDNDVDELLFVGGFLAIGNQRRHLRRVLLVRITDNDKNAPALRLVPQSLAVGEGGSSTYRVRLSSQPAATVTVAITGQSGTDLTLDETSLMFTMVNWDTDQTVTVSAGSDLDRDDDVVTLLHTASGANYDDVKGNVLVTVTDDDDVGLTVSTTALGVAEGGDAEYTVRLATQPTAQVTVAITGTASTDLTLDATSLTFTTATWNTAQTVTVSAGEDDDGANDAATLLHTASGGDYAGETASVAVTTTDDESVGLTLSTTTLGVAEGGDAEYTVRLATQPTAQVTLAITGQAGTDLTLDATSLTFTTATWNTAQTVTVSAGEDDDGANDAATLLHTASGGDYAGETASVAVTTTDDESVGLTLSTTTLGVAEGGDAEYTVRLATQPTAQVTVAITGTASTDLTLDATSLTFTTATWNTAQTVTVSAGEDDDGANDAATLLHTASGGDYAGETASVAVTVTDDDDVGLTVSTTALGVAEGDDGEYTVRLSTQPTATVTVAISGHSGTDLTLDATSLTFTTATWNTAQTVTVEAGEDDDGANDAATLLHTASGGDYAGETASVAVTTTDDESVGLTLSTTTLGVAEGGDAEYTVRLATQPTAQVTVAITGTASTDLTLDATSLTFTTATWNTAQTVTVSAGEDDDGANDAATLLHTASGGDYAGETASVAVTTTDDDSVGLTLSTTTTLGVAEGGDAEYTVRLSTQPTATVTVAISGHSGTDLTLDATSLTFTTATWNTAQTVTVSAGEDDDGANDAATLLHTASGGDYAGETASVAVTTTDDDSVGLTLSTTTLGVAEGGDAEYTVRLATQPTAQVTLAITGQAGTDLTLDATSLTFTTATWNTAQTVTVSAGEDDDGANDAATLLHTASGGDYAGETASVAVTTTDDDSVGLTLSTTTLGVAEGDDAEYTVRLATQPTAQVTLAITGQAGTDLTLDATSLTFTTATWNTAQTVTVSAGEDDDGANDAATLLHTASGGDYAGETASVAVTVTDDDDVGLTVSTTALGVAEGDDGEYTVRLSTQPTATVTVAISGHSGTDLTLDATSLTFTTATWNTAQTVTVEAGEDDDGANDAATLLHTASGGDYAGETASVAVTTTDDESVGLTLSTTTLGVAEGGDAEYTVRLATQPTAQVTVAITGTASTDLTLDATSLTFTTATWNTAQTVTVSAGEDDDGANDAATLLHTASGGDYAGETASVAVTTTDDDSVGLTLSTTTLGVAEGGDAEYTVRLATQPTAQVTVAITGTASTDLTLDATSLTFTTATWNTAQTVTVSAGEDDDGANDAATLLHTASGGDYAGETASVAVTTTDDESVGLTLSTTTLGVAEGGDAEYTVRLATQPTAQVTVAITGTASTDLTLDATSLTFTTATWNTAQTVTVSAGEDDDGANDAATLLHTASGGDYAGETASVAVTTTDDESVGLTLSTTTLGVAEGGDAEYTVRLATQPTAQVTVAITGTASTDLTLDATSLTFTTATWNTAQTVTVSAGEDDDGANDAATLLHTASGGDYAGETASVAVTTTDDDSVGLTLSTTTLGVAEGGDAEYTVRLATQPTAQVTLAITGQAGTDLTLDATSLTFTTATWNTAQTVTVSAGEDDDGANDAATLLHTASGGDYAGETASVAVTTTDDDSVGLTLSTTTLGVAEGDDAEYTVRLATQPTAQVTLAITGQAGTDLTLDATSLTFTTATWNTAQTVTVSAGEDDDGANDAATLLHTASGGDYAGETASVAVTTTDDESVGLTLSTTTLGVAEGGDAEYTVRLATQPTAQVTVAITGTASTDLTLDATSLTFTTATWNTAQTVTVSAGEDDDGANDAATLLHTASGGDYAGETASVAVTTTDDESVGLTLSTTTLGVAEGGDAEYTVRLATQPTAQVTVAITGTASTDLTLDATSLTFTTATWNTAQTVTVSAGEDDDGANDAATLLHTASGGDYAGETASVAVTTTDDESVGLTLSTTTLGVAEGGDAEYTVRLATQPTAQVTVAITGTASTDLTLDATSLTFTTATWNTAQTVTVSAGEDDDGANDAATLLHTASGGDYAGETASVAVTTTDDDSVGLTLSTTTLGVAEGGDAEYTVRLATQPTAQVTVAITGTASTDLTLDATSLTFTTATWNTAQTVTVSAGEDDDGANDAATLLHTASGGDYAGETASVAVTTTDDESVGLTLSTTTLGVAEGGDAEYTVRLATQPTAQVTVAITGTASTDLTLDATSLTFTTATWNTAQTVTVSAGEDDDGANDAATLLHTASGGDYAGETASVAVTTTDDDSVGLTLSTTTLGVAEGGDAEYTVRLATQPTAQVTLAITGQAGTDLTLDATSLTFTTATWNTAQTVTVSAGEDDDGANDAATLLHTASGGDYAGETASVAVTTTDDESVGLTLSTTTLGVAEGGDAEYTVRLATQPTAQVTLAITGQAGTDLTLDATSLTFTTATWNTAQTVTVSAGEDDDGANDAATLLHTASGGDYAGETASVAVTVTDDDDVGLTVSTTALGVAEGDDGEYTVRLSTQPTATVTVAISGHSGTDLTLDATSLTFTTATWNTAQTVTVEAGEDDDGANDAATLLHTASGGDYAGETASVAVTTTDDESVGLTLSTTTLGVAEGGDAEYTVRLATQPTAQVTVAITGTASTDLTLDATSLTFTTATWNTAQTVTVSAGEDDDGANDAATLLHTASGGDYAGETASVAVTTTDDESVGLTLSTTTLGVAEGGDAEYTVRLSTQPTATVTVAISGHSGTDLTLDATSLTFTTATWNTAQTVTVSAGEDDDGANDAATLLHTASGGDYAGETASVAVTTTDDESVGLTLSTTTLGVAEGGDAEYTVRLATQPTAQVTLAITGQAGTDLTLDATSLTFTTATWNTAQTVTVSAGEDDDGANDAATLLHTASGGDYAGETASVAVTTTDDDSVGLTLSTTTLGVAEGGDAEYTVRLATQPTAQVTVAITGTASTDLTLDATSLTFTTATWNTAQTVTVSAGEDDDGANDAATLLHTASGGDYAGETASVAVTTTDDESVGLTLSTTTTLGVAEGGDAEYTVRLSTQPTATVTVAISGHSGTDLTLDATSLTFTTATWNTAQTVTVSAGEDDDGANDAATLLHTASGGDYAGETASVAVTTTDDDSVGLTLSTTTLGVAEGGDAEYTVRLATQPTAQVTLAITGQAGTDLTLDATSLTFTTATWNTAQTVTVSAGEDDDGANDAATLLHTASGGDYAGETASVAVTTTDDDSVGLTLSTTTLGVAEGGDAEYTVRLATQPTAQVTVAITGTASTDLTLDATSLTFTTATWNTAQTVTVSAGEDDDGANDAATLLHTASGGDYAGETASVAVTTTDDESVGLTLSTTTLGVAEGGDAEYTVRLATQPTAQVTVAITGTASTDLTLDATSLTFTTATWNTAQTVTVSAGEDDDGANDAATLLHTASGGDYAGETASVAVTTTDDESVGLTLSTTTLGVAEGGDAEYTVRLSTQPTATVTVAISGHSGTDLTLDATSLTFTTATWNTAQTVTVSAGEDDDGANDAATLLHTASGGDYAGETASVAVTTTDDESVGLTLSTTTLGVAEGGDAEYTVRLATQPTAQVTVAITGTASTDLTLDATSLTFTTATWNTAQTVTVEAGEDDDGANDAATLLHTASGGDYAGETASVAVTTTDDESVGLTLSTTTLGVAEGGDAEYTVRLATQPTAQVTLAITGQAGTDLTLDATSLTFTTATWNTAQTVTVSAGEDDDGANDAATLLHTASGGDYAGETASVAVTTTDDDSVGLTLSTTTLGVAEGGDAEYTVRLATQPTAQVTVAITGTASTDLTLDATSLTFTTATWNTAQTVTVSAGEDDDGANDAATLLHTASGGDYAGETASVAVTTTDDESVGLTLSTTTTLGVAEGGDAEYTVRLSTQPTATVTVAISGHSGTDLTLDATSLTFTTATWNTAQTVTVSAGEDDDGANDAATLLHTASGGDYAGETASVAVTTTDDDSVGLTLSTTTLGVAEGGDAEYTVRLATQPTAQVTLAITGQAGTDLTLDATSLTFTTATWNTAQTVTVSAGEDDDGANDAATLLHTASGGDYAGETASVAVTTTDDDSVGLTLSTTTLGVAEGGDAEYTVRLATQPTAQVTVAITGTASTDLTLDATSLTFTTATWNTAQTVTVSAGEDDDGANDAATLLHTASGGDYAGETASVAVTTTDDDSVGLTLSTTTLGVAEGGDAEYTVRLATQPTAQVTVAITGTASTDLTLDATSLTFTTATWNTAQTVTVSAGEDDDGANDAATLLHTASGGDYAGETASVAVTTTDDESVGLTLSTTTLGVAEGGDAEYTVRLATQPTAQVTVAITGTASTDLTLDATSLTFTTATWNTAQTVTVSAGEDDDGANDAATLLHTASGGDYAGETASVAVTTTDDESVGLTLSTTTLGVAEGGDAEYTVRLATQPTAQVTLAITGQAGTDLTLDATSLTFTTATWNTAQTVTVSAGEDDDGANDAATLLHTASGGDYAGETASVAVTTTDDDSVGLTLSTTTLGVAEGDDAEYTVRLATQPTAQVTLAITGQAGTDLTLDATSLTFTTATWNTAQTVTVSAGEDDDGANDAATLLHTASGGDYAGETASVAVTVTDDDDVGLTVSTTALGVAEGDDGEYTVRLSTQPTATVTVAISGHSGTDLTLDATSLTFTTATWNTAQTVTVEAGEDDDGANDAATLLHTASGGDYAGETASVAVTTTDDESVGLTLSTTTLGVAEGGDAEYTVRLATQPTAQVTVAITGTASTDLTLDATSLTFTTATWNTAQTVTVSAGEDDDGANDAATLLHTASGGDYAGETASVAVTTTDDESVGLTLSTTTLGVAEGGDAEYTVRLATQPTAQVTVAITGTASTDLTLDATSLTFTTATWNTAQTVTVSAGEDDDGANDAATLLHTASGGDYAGETASVAVTTTDDESVGLTLSTTTLGVAEGGDAEYTVRLATQPTAQVTVAITGTASTDLTLDATSLTFTTATWNTAQTVTVSAGEDDDGANDAATLLHTASGGDYAGETASVAVTTTDDESVGLTLSTTTLGVAEGGDAEYTVRLATQPTAQVTVAITGTASTDLTLDATSLTFTTATWNTAQTVTVEAGEDDDGANDAATLLHTASGGDYAGETASVAVTTTDDESVGLTLSTTTLGVAEGGDAEYTVRLSTQPTATVTVAISGHSGTDLTLDATSLTFTTATWNTAQTVTVSAGEDDDGANDAATLLHTASGGDYAGETASVAVTTTDDESVGLTLSTTTLGVAEGGDAEYTVRLATQPTAQVTVAITGTASTDLTLDATSLTFTTATWNTAQTVTVSAGEDDDGANDAATLLHTASGGDYAGETASVAVTTTDDESVGLTLSTTTTLGVAEGGDAEYTVRLSTQPTATVTVAISGHSGTDLTLDATSLTFTTATWNTAQTVTVSAGEDDDGANDAATLLHTASGGDYAGETASVAVTTTDDDSVGLTLSTTTLGVAEGGDAEYTVRLATQPTAQVTLAITGQAGTDLTLDATSLTFTTATWNTAQTVTVSAGEDDDGANDAATLLHTASGGDYAGETASVAVTTTDDDSVGLTLSTTTLGVAEGDDAEYTVRLATQPTAQVTLAITGQAGTDLTLDATSLTFTTATWNTAQTVTVSAGEDDDGANDAATLLHTASGGDYAGETASVAVTVTDDDDVGLTVSTTALGVAEGDDGEYTVRLSTQPTATVTVAISGHSGTDLTLDATSLTFTTATWNTAQTVTVEAGEDDDGANDAATLLHTASGGDYAGETASVAVTTTDDESVGLTLSTTTLGVAEGGDAEYTVRLATQPTAQVTVAITGTASTDLTLDATSLTFTTATWNTAQTVTVSAGEDDDGANDAATLLHTASGGDYAGETASVAVTTTDDESVGLTLSTTTLGVAEGGDAEYTVRLATQPTAQVTVAITGTASTDLTLDATSLTFTTATWNTAQTVTVSAGEDDDGANDAATLLHTASGGDYAGETASVAVTTTDDESVGLTLSTTTLGVAEGGDAEYTVRLATQPTAQVTVAITGTASTDLTLDATSLTFTTATWNTAQTVTVSAGEDDDGANDAATLLHTASGGDYAGETASVAVTTTDDESVGLTLSTTTLGVAEGGDAEYTVRLATQPTAQVTVAITGTASTDLTLDATSLTFTTATWNTAQTVTVSAGEDDDGANDAATLLHTASGGDYAGETASVAVTTTDDESVGLTLSTTTLGVAEGGDAEYTVRLATQPTAQVTVAITGTASTDLTLDATSLTFTTATWNTAQTVTVSAGEDDDGANDAATLLHTASGGDYAGETASVAVTTTDDDSAGLVLSTETLGVAEGGDAEYTVRLATQPTAQVTVAITGQAGTDLTLDATSLTFTTATWNTAQTVTVSADEDPDAANDTATLLHTASGGGYAGETASVAVTTTDDESADLVLSTETLGVAEGGDAEYTVRLSTQPTATVTVAISGHSGTDLTLDATSLTFTTATWNAAQTVTVSAAPDDDAQDDLATLLHTASGGGAYEGRQAALSVVVAEPSAPLFALADASAVEGRPAVFALTRRDAAEALSGTWAALEDAGAEHPATAGEDFAAASGTIDFAPGQARATFSVETLADRRAEPPESFLAEARLAGTTLVAAGTIRDPAAAESASRSAREPGTWLWTDQLAYLPGDSMQLYLNLEPHGQEEEYSAFVYLTELGTGGRAWLDLSRDQARLEPEAVDLHGQSDKARWAQRLLPVERQLEWDGPAPAPGHWHFVAELRSPAGTQVLKRAYAKFLVAENGTALVARAGIERRLRADERWGSDTVRYLGGRLIVPRGVTLEIEAGTHLLAWGRGAGIVVEAGGRIVARGRRDKPVVMTCGLPVGRREPGCWAGLQIFGEAQPDGAGAVDSQGAGSTPGAGAAGDSSGELRYVRVEFAGGGLDGPRAAVSLHRAGAGTVLEHVQAHASLGSGFRFQGGGAGCRRCVASNSRQAGVQWDGGYRGLLQDLYVQQAERAATGLLGIAGPESGPGPALYNATLVGGWRGAGRPGSAIRLEGAAALHARNVIATGFRGYGIEARAGAAEHFASGASSVKNAIIHLNGRGAAIAQAAPFVERLRRLPRLLNVRPEPNPDPRPRSGSVALVPENAALPPFGGPHYRRAPYVGAFGRENWLEQWTWFGSEEHYREEPYRATE